jgi:hypothetical protein
MSRGEHGTPGWDGTPGRGEVAGGGWPAREEGHPGPLRPTSRSGLIDAPAEPPTVLTAASSVDGIAVESTDAVGVRVAFRRFLATCVEVVGGYRPVVQLRPFCLPERFESIVNRLLRPGGAAMGRGHGATRASIVASPGGPHRAGRLAPNGPGDRVTVRRVKLCDVRADIAEIAVVMARRDKVWAMAIRMELARGRWQCTHLEVL